MKKQEKNIRSPAQLEKSAQPAPTAKSTPVKPVQKPKPEPAKTKSQPAKKTEPTKGSLTSLDKKSLGRLKIAALVLFVISIVTIALFFGLRSASSAGLSGGQTNPPSSTQTPTGNNPSSGNGGTNPIGPPVDSTPGSPLSLTAKSRLQQADYSQILVAQQPDLTFKQSDIYKPADMIKAVEQAVQFGVGAKKFWFGDGNDVYGLVGVAAFLSQAMKEAIQYDAVDENLWDQTTGYSAASACGQLGQAYDKYTCSGNEVGLECKVDPNKVVVARTNAKWYGAPGPLFAAPKSIVPKAPKWNYGSPWCNPAETRTKFASDLDYVRAIAKFDSSATCRMYDGQKAGGWELCGGAACPNNPAPNFGVPARTDVEGCYFWGRGAIQTTGVCNYGKLNYYAGKRGASEGRKVLFPDVDFCQNPEEISISSKYPELKWFAGLFYWMDAVQDYDDGKWNYKRELKKFVDSGFPNPGSDTGFIRGVSGIVNRGCADPPNCGTGPLDGGPDRAKNFEKVLKAFKLI